MSDRYWYFNNNYQGMNSGPRHHNQRRGRGRGGHNQREMPARQYHDFDYYQNQQPWDPRYPYDQRRDFSSNGNDDYNYYPRQGSYKNSPRPRHGKRKKVDDDVTVSKGLAFILRHGAFKMNLDMNQEGFVYVNDILKHPKYRHVTEDDIKRIVQNNNKQRFHLKEDQHGYLMIGANQGHTLKVENIDLEPITDAKSHPCVVHGTTYQAWESIKGEGLKAMGRNHIHFARGEPGDEEVISGMRASSRVLIFLDLERALNDGIKFFISRNGVILSEGNKKGIIDPGFFAKVIDRKTRAKLFEQKKKTRKRKPSESASSSNTATDAKRFKK